MSTVARCLFLTYQGIAPGRAIKLSTNNFVRDSKTDPETGEISLGWEIIAGSIAGAVHVVRPVAVDTAVITKYCLDPRKSSGNRVTFVSIIWFEMGY